MNKCEDICRELRSYSDEFDRLNALIAYSAQLPEPSPLLLTQEHLVSGCQSKVWTQLIRQNGHVFLNAYSDTRIIRGILAILKHILDGEPEEILSSLDESLLSRLGIEELLSANRRSGFRAILASIQG